VADSQYDQFLKEATVSAVASGPAPGPDCLYGVYTSWCLLFHRRPGPENAFWEAMRKKKIRPGKTPLQITGPAAVDYILSTYPDLVRIP
jgi:hypothetical protein